MNIGCDIEKVDRFNGFTDEQKFRIFNVEEIYYAKTFNENENQHLAGFYCAKEALVKCLKKGVKLNYNDIEVSHDENQAPFFIFHNENAKLVEGLKFNLSISHTDENALAVVICEND
jgi:phosphopantetheine--protein transferase-like protein